MHKIQAESFALIALQFLCIGILVYLTLGISLSLVPVIMITLAVGIGLWSILTMRFGNFRIQPLPKKEAKLVTSGPYRFIRHPMYSAVLLGMLGITINIGSWIGYIIWLVLVIDFTVKLRFEEKLLIEKFSEYREYMKRTSRLLPFLKF